MKQRPTPQQVFDLSEKGQKRLRDKWEPKPGDIIVTESDDSPQVLLGNMNGKYSQEKVKLIKETHKSLPLLSIGQMIEFIENHFTETTEVQVGWSDYEDQPYNFGRVEIGYFGKRGGRSIEIRIKAIDIDEGIRMGYISKLDNNHYWEDDLKPHSGNLTFEELNKWKREIEKQLVWGYGYEHADALWNATKEILEK